MYIKGRRDCQLNVETVVMEISSFFFVFTFASADLPRGHDYYIRSIKCRRRKKEMPDENKKGENMESK